MNQREKADFTQGSILNEEPNPPAMLGRME